MSNEVILLSDSDEDSQLDTFSTLWGSLSRQAQTTSTRKAGHGQGSMDRREAPSGSSGSSKTKEKTFYSKPNIQPLGTLQRDKLRSLAQSATQHAQSRKIGVRLKLQNTNVKTVEHSPKLDSTSKVKDKSKDDCSESSDVYVLDSDSDFDMPSGQAEREPVDDLDSQIEAFDSSDSDTITAGTSSDSKNISSVPTNRFSRPLQSPNKSKPSTSKHTGWNISDIFRIPATVSEKVSKLVGLNSNQSKKETKTVTDTRSISPVLFTDEEEEQTVEQQDEEEQTLEQQAEEEQTIEQQHYKQPITEDMETVDLQAKPVSGKSCLSLPRQRLSPSPNSPSVSSDVRSSTTVKVKACDAQATTVPYKHIDTSSLHADIASYISHVSHDSHSESQNDDSPETYVPLFGRKLNIKRRTTKKKKVPTATLR